MRSRCILWSRCWIWPKLFSLQTLPPNEFPTVHKVLLKVAAVFWTDGCSPSCLSKDLICFKISKDRAATPDAIFAETYLDGYSPKLMTRMAIWQKSNLAAVNISLWCVGSIVVDKTKQSIYRKTKQRPTRRKMMLAGKIYFGSKFDNFISLLTFTVLFQQEMGEWPKVLITRSSHYKFVYCIELSLLLVPVLPFFPP